MLFTSFAFHVHYNCVAFKLKSVLVVLEEGTQLLFVVAKLFFAVFAGKTFVGAL